MTSPLERAARALAVYVPETIAKEAARAVIEAIREPGEAIAQEAFIVGGTSGLATYQHMIDRLLRE